LGSSVYGQALFTHPNNLTLLDGPLSAPSWLKFLPPATLLILLTLIPTAITQGSNFTSSPSIKVGVINSQSYGIARSHSLSLWTGILNHFNIYNHWIMHNS